MKLALIALLLPSALAAVKKTAANAKETAFLEEYATGEGTQVTDSGLMYRVLKDGSGGSPELATPCSRARGVLVLPTCARPPDAVAATRRSRRCHYEGRTATNYPSGKTFDSSYARGQPTTFAPRQVIAAWTEAMQKMTVGSKWELVCPPEIAYGGRAMGSDIPANSVLVFTMEMLSCQGVSAEL